MKERNQQQFGYLVVSTRKHKNKKVFLACVYTSNLDFKSKKEKKGNTSKDFYLK